jgi:hypothetical protein
LFGPSVSRPVGIEQIRDRLFPGGNVAIALGRVLRAFGAFLVIALCHTPRHFGLVELGDFVVLFFVALSGNGIRLLGFDALDTSGRSVIGPAIVPSTAAARTTAARATFRRASFGIARLGLRFGFDFDARLFVGGRRFAGILGAALGNAFALAPRSRTTTAAPAALATRLAFGFVARRVRCRAQVSVLKVSVLKVSVLGFSVLG